MPGRQMLPTRDGRHRRTIHLTLLFLGEVGEERPPAVLQALGGLKSTPLEIRLTRLDTFPRAGVLFVDVEPAPRLLQLQAQVSTRMTQCGFALEPRPYHPHITLARLRRPVRLIGKRLILPPELQRNISVNEVNLYRSHTTPAGAHYEVLARNRL